MEKRSQTSADVSSNLQAVLNVETLSDVDELSIERLREGIALVQLSDDPEAFVLLSDLSEQQIFEARSSIAYHAECRDKAWSRLECWGSKLVAKDCSTHIRERVLHLCCEFANYVALCANSLSLYDVDWSVVLDSSGFQLTSDDGDGYRRPDVCLAAKVKYYGLRPLVIVDFFSNSPASRSVASAKHWLSNYSSVQYVISVDVRIGDSLMDELSPDAPPPVVRHQVELEVPQTCLTKISIFARPGGSFSSMTSPLGSIPVSLNEFGGGGFGGGSWGTRLPVHEPSVPYGIAAAVPNLANWPMGSGWESATSARMSFDFAGCEFTPSGLGADSTSGYGPDLRRCSTVLLPTAAQEPILSPLHEIASPNVAPRVGCVGGLRRERGMVKLDGQLPRGVGSSNFLSATPGASLKGTASCATLATVASESDYGRLIQQSRGVCVVAAELEGFTCLSYQFTAAGVLEHIAGLTAYSCRKGGSESEGSAALQQGGVHAGAGPGVTVANHSHNSVEKQLSAPVSIGNSSYGIRRPSGFGTSCSVSSLAACCTMSGHQPSSSGGGSASSSNADFNNVVEDRTAGGEGLLVSIPLSSICRSLQRFLTVSSYEREKADVLRLVVNFRRLIEEGVMVGINRDLKFKLRRKDPTMLREQLLASLSSAK